MKLGHGGREHGGDERKKRSREERERCRGSGGVGIGRRGKKKGLVKLPK